MGDKKQFGRQKYFFPMDNFSRIALAALGLIFALIVAGCTQNMMSDGINKEEIRYVKYASKYKGKPSFLRPKGWVYKKPRKEDTSAAFSLNNDKRYGENASLFITFHPLVEFKGNQNLLLEETVNRFVKDSQRVGNMVLWQRPRSISGTDGIEFALRYHSKQDGDSAETTWDYWGLQVSTLVIYKEQLYELSYDAGGDYFPAYYEVYETAVNSFRFNE